MSELIEQVFAPSGLLAQRFAQHEQRDGQAEMAAQVLAALEDGEHTAIQAGTGLGKTFAYLIPAAVYAVEHQKRVVISTGTLNLQGQIMNKDIPTIQQILAGKLNFTAVLVKGRNNYLCARKLAAFAEANRQIALLREPGDAEQWFQIAELYDGGMLVEGDRDEIPFRVSESLWADIGSEAIFCTRSKCSFINKCFFYQARQRQSAAQLLITNHALFFADLAIRLEDSNAKEQRRAEAEDFLQYGEAPVEYNDEPADFVLSSYGAAIFDEAQSVEDFATECFTARFGWERLFYLGRNISNAIKPNGILEWPDENDQQRLESLFNVVLNRTEVFLTDLARRWDGERTVRLRQPRLFEEDLSVAILELAEEIQQLSTIAQKDEQQEVLAAYAKRAEQLAKDLLVVKEMPFGERYAYWLETGERQLRQIKLAASPVSIADFMRDGLLQRVPVVLTSATLASELVKRLGLTSPRWLRLDSPFDYEHHTRLYLPNDAPEASPQNEIRFNAFVARRVCELTAISQGRAFILFTSYRAMQVCYQQCKEELNQQGWLVLMQGEKRRDQLLADFIADGRAVLFAVNSFWEGVDVPGEALSLVVLVKLPFAVPTEPIQQARMEALEREGVDPFRSYTLPQASLRLKQGFGRLIRNKQDTGVIAVLDRRISTKFYGQRFLRDLPAAPRLETLAEVAAFFDLLEEERRARQRGETFVWP